MAKNSVVLVLLNPQLGIKNSAELRRKARPLSTNPRRWRVPTVPGPALSLLS